MKNIYGQIIALTKNIHLIKPLKEDCGAQKFIAGKQEFPNLFSGIAVSWWYTKKTHSLVENISMMITKNVPEFSDCDHESIQKIIQATFKEICIDSKLFDSTHVLCTKKDTLFDCRVKIETNEYARCIFDRVQSNIRNSISDWCVTYVAPRITGESFSIKSERINIIHKQDQKSWDELAKSGYLVNTFQQQTGTFFDGGPSPFKSIEYDYLFVSFSHGTDNGSKFSSSLKLKKLFSVIYAASNIENNRKRHKVVAKPNTYSIQFPHKSSGVRSISISTIGELLPYYADDNVLNKNIIKKIQQWYEAECKLEPDQKNRISKCAYFINRGMNSNDIDSYIHFFVALDALYGRKGSVKQSIINGVSSLPQSNNWISKVSWLFDLRNELVHGGSRYIKEWPKYAKYYNHFLTEPDKDVEQLAMLALIGSPAIMNKLKGD